MATKKKVSGRVTVFNKKSAEAFADKIYSDKRGEVKFLKLCGGALSNGPDGGRTMHCAVGEAYYNFVSKKITPVIADEDTTGAIRELATRAGVTGKKKSKLMEALRHLYQTNDQSGTGSSSCTPSGYLDRAREVARVWREEIIPLLK